MFRRKAKIEAVLDRFEQVSADEAARSFEVFSSIAPEIVRLRDEQMFMSLTAWDWAFQMDGAKRHTNISRDEAECALVPTTTRLLIAGPGRTAKAIRYDVMKHLHASRLGAQGFVKFTAYGREYNFTTKPLAARALVAFIDERRA
jgi:hypothetical protein